MDLLTGGEKHFHLVMAAQSAAMVEVHSTQLLYTGEIITDVKKKETNNRLLALITVQP